MHDTVELAVQVNGKVRGRIEASAGASEQELVELASLLTQSRGSPRRQTLRKTIVVPRKLVKMVVS